MKTFYTILAIVIATILLALVAIKTYDRVVTRHCTELQSQAQANIDNKAYYITKMDHDECLNQYNINILAPVK